MSRLTSLIDLDWKKVWDLATQKACLDFVVFGKIFILMSDFKFGPLCSKWIKLMSHIIGFCRKEWQTKDWENGLRQNNLGLYQDEITIDVMHLLYEIDDKILQS